jgi:hypothetical protein
MVMVITALMVFWVMTRPSYVTGMQNKIGLKPLRVVMWAFVIVHWGVAFGLIAVSYNTYGMLDVNTWYVLVAVIVYMCLMIGYLRVVDTLDRALRIRDYTAQFGASAARAKARGQERIKEFFTKSQS